MKKLGIIAFILILITSSLVGCTGTNPEQLMKKPGKTEQQQQALTQIEKDLPHGAIKEVRQIAISSRLPAEYVAIYTVPVEDRGTPKKSGVIVEQYDSQKKIWSKAWEGSWEYRDLKFIGKDKLMGDTREQVAIGGWSGNGGYFEYILLGEKDGKIIPLLNKIDNEGIPNGGLEFEKGGFTTFSGSQGTHYVWQGQSFATTAVVVLPDMKDRKDGDLSVHYSFDDQENGTLSDCNQTVNLKVGQKLYLVRDNANGIWERIMLTGDNVTVLDSYAWSIFEAKISGKTQIQIVPNGYDWDKALSIKVIVNY